MKLVNLTQHTVTLLDHDDPMRHVEVHPDGQAARVQSDMHIDEFFTVDGVRIPVISVHDRRLLNLPEPEEGVLYIVSGLVAAAAQRPDVVSPARVIRDPIDGRTRGAKALMRP